MAATTFLGSFFASILEDCWLERLLRFSRSRLVSYLAALVLSPPPDAWLGDFFSCALAGAGVAAGFDTFVVLFDFFIFIFTMTINNLKPRQIYL